jgi:hypothetical protein
MRTLYIVTSFICLLAACSPKTASQGNDQAASTSTELLESRNYVFKAITAIPARGRSIQLNSDYTLRVSKDTVRADLPFFGRAYTAPIGQSSGGFEFTSTQFDYKQNVRKNGAYEIEIIPRDHRDVQRMLLTVSTSGYGSLYINIQRSHRVEENTLIQLHHPHFFSADLYRSGKIE